MEFETIFTVIISVIFGGVSGSVITHFLQRDKERKDFLKQKAEDLYMTAHGYCGGLSGFFLQQHFLFKGEGTVQDYYKSISHLFKPNIEEKFHEKMVMLNSIYFPQILEKMDKVYDCRGKMVRIGKVLIEGIEAGKGINPRRRKKFEKKFDELENLIKDYKEAILKEAQKI